MTRVQTGVPLAEQRLALRQKLQDQRRRIAQRLDEVDAADATFPRSMTMRLVIRRPDLVIRLVLGVAALFKLRGAARQRSSGSKGATG